MALPPLPDGKYQVHLGEFGERWFEAIAEIGQLTPGKVRVDLYGADYHLTHNVSSEVTRWQIKTTESPKSTNGGASLSLTVPVDRFKLMAGGTVARSFYGLIIVDSEYPGWSEHPAAGSTILRATGYYLETTNCQVPDGQESITLSLPVVNMITPETLHGIY